MVNRRCQVNAFFALIFHYIYCSESLAVCPYVCHFIRGQHTGSRYSTIFLCGCARAASMHWSHFIFRMQCVYVSRWTHVINWCKSFHFILFGLHTARSIHIINVAVCLMTVRGYRTRVESHIYLVAALTRQLLQNACKVTHHAKFLSFFWEREDGGLAECNTHRIWKMRWRNLRTTQKKIF